MNKSEVIKKIMEVTGLSEEKCLQINEVIENYFIIGKNNKEKIISDLIEKLKINKDMANDIYNKVMSVIAGGIKDKLKNPFKSLD